MGVGCYPADASHDYTVMMNLMIMDGDVEHHAIDVIMKSMGF